MDEKFAISAEDIVLVGIVRRSFMKRSRMTIKYRFSRTMWISSPSRSIHIESSDRLPGTT